VRNFCLDQALPALANDAELCTSELVTNAIEHTGTLITLVAMRTDDGLIVNVRDDDASCGDLVAALPEAAAESGRGMHVVGMVAGDWGVSRHEDGKSVWFRLP
jgi:anti-sigma regulatory factor (Ser/Thr protein kinase)